MDFEHEPAQRTLKEAVSGTASQVGRVERHGTQSIERALLLLRKIASRGRFGWGLTHLARHAGLDRGTTHRILSCLVRERVVQQRDSDRLYHLGPLVFELGLTLSAHANFQAACRLPLDRLARRFGALAILYLRSGDDWVCAGCVGPLAYAGSNIEVGKRRPLLSSAGGIAILVALDDDEARRIINENLRDLAHLGEEALQRLLTLYARSRPLGYALNRGDTTQNVRSFAMPLRDPAGQVFGSLAVSAPAPIFPDQQTPDVIATLEGEARRVEGEAQRIFVPQSGS